MIKNPRAVLVAAALVLSLAGLAAAGFPGFERDEREPPFQGVVEYEERVLGFEVGGRVRTVDVERGARVAAKQQLARLDDELARATSDARHGEVEAARAQVKLLEAGSRPEEIRGMAAKVRAAAASEAQLAKNLAREQSLARRGVTPPAAVEELESQLKRATAERQALEQSLGGLKKGARAAEFAVAEARVKSAVSIAELEDARLARHLLRSDWTGQVLDVHVESGEIVAAGAPVVTLADTGRPYADVFVPEDRIGGIRIGGKAEVRVDALPEALTARVENVSRRAEFTPRFLFSERERRSLVIRVRVRIDDPGEKLHAGLPAFVRIERQP